ncbi:MAG: AraC family transcriptional regulator [Pseudomonadales bacterium]|nr:AraC family transcriptional regulator [Pseudomonadales bacterium]
MTPPLSDILPTHQVGEYSAWLCADNPNLPYDMVWMDLAGKSPRPHRVLPLGEPSIAIFRQKDAKGRVIGCDLVICSQYSSTFWHNPQPFEETIALRLKPETSALFLNIDPVDYSDMLPVRVPLSLYSKFSNSLCVAESQVEPSTVARALSQDLSRAIRHPRTIQKFTKAVATLRKNAGSISIKSLSERFELHPRQMHRLFQHHLGVTPKFYARRLRIAQAAILSDRSVHPRWADIALSCGFHDQSHLINEYKQLINLTPAQSHRERLGLSDFSNSADSP